MNREGDELRKVAEYPASGPEWSPGDRRILYARIFGYRAFYLVRLDGSEPFELKSWEEPASMPAWSPDGQYVAFVQERDLKILDLYTNMETFLVDRVALKKPSWSPDGTRLAFTTYDSNIAVVDVETLEITQLTGTPGQTGASYSPSWEPDRAGLP